MILPPHTLQECASMLSTTLEYVTVHCRSMQLCTAGVRNSTLQVYAAMLSARGQGVALCLHAALLPPLHDLETIACCKY